MTDVPPAEVVAALDRAWHQVRRRHPEVPPVVLLLGPSPSRQGAKWCTLGHLRSFGWSLHSSIPNSSALEELRAATRRLEEGVAARAEAEISRHVADAAEATGIVLEEIFRQAADTYPEVFIASELIADGAARMFAVLLPWRRRCIQTLGMPFIDRASKQ